VSNYTDDRVLGEMLYTTALAYFFELDIYNEILSRTSGVFLMRQPSEAMVALDIAVGYLFWSPYDLDIAGLNIDVDRNVYTVLSESGSSEEARSFMLTSGSVGSALEHSIFEQLYSVPSVSTVKILQVASEQGLKIYNINASNVDVVLPRLQVSQEVKDAIRNAVAQGREVTIPERNIQYYNWTGVGYIVLDPETGAGAYMISGGLAGGSWALIMKCFVEVYEFVKSILFGFKSRIEYLEDLSYDIIKSPIENLEKVALGLMIGLLIFHSIVFQLAGGVVFTVPGLILTILFVMYSFILVTLITYYIGKEFLPSCRVLLEGQE